MTAGEQHPQRLLNIASSSLQKAYHKLLQAREMELTMDQPNCETWGVENRGTTAANGWQELNRLSWENEQITGKQKHSAMCILNVALQIQVGGRRMMVSLSWGGSELGTLEECLSEKHGRWRKKKKKKRQQKAARTQNNLSSPIF